MGEVQLYRAAVLRRVGMKEGFFKWKNTLLRINKLKWAAVCRLQGVTSPRRSRAHPEHRCMATGAIRS